MKKYMAGILAFIFVITGSVCFSQEVVSDTTGKIGLGLKISNMSTGAENFKDRELDKENGIMIGGSLSYGVNRWFSLELAYEGTLQREERDDTLGVKMADIDIYPLTFSMQFRYITDDPNMYKWMVPYLTLGVGYYFVSGDMASEYKNYNAPNETKLDFDGGWGWHIGGGIDMFATNYFALGLEGRYFWAQSSIEETQYNPTFDVRSTQKEDVNWDGWMVGVNLKFFFSPYIK
jgi:outer membrane protein W